MLPSVITTFLPNIFVPHNILLCSSRIFLTSLHLCIWLMVNFLLQDYAFGSGCQERSSNSRLGDKDSGLWNDKETRRYRILPEMFSGRGRWEILIRTTGLIFFKSRLYFSKVEYCHNCIQSNCVIEWNFSIATSTFTWHNKLYYLSYFIKALSFKLCH